MKKSIILALVAIAITTKSVKAQQATTMAAPTAQQAPNALSKLAVLKLSAAGFSNELLGKAYPIFSEYYTYLQTAIPEDVAKIVTKRDDNLRVIFTEAQMATWKNTVEPALVAGK
jgi:hypothetical protein